VGSRAFIAPDAHRDFPALTHDRFRDGDIGTADYPSWEHAREAMRSRSDVKRVNALKRSIRDNGLFHPVTVYTDDDGRHWVADGHHRIEALRQLGLQVPVRLARHGLHAAVAPLEGVPPVPGTLSTAASVGA
jgi:hypothetical protein